MWLALALLCLQNKLLRSNYTSYVVTVIKEKMFGKTRWLFSLQNRRGEDKGSIPWSSSSRVTPWAVWRFPQVSVGIGDSYAFPGVETGAGTWGHILADALMIEKCDFLQHGAAEH